MKISRALLGTALAAAFSFGVVLMGAQQAEARCCDMGPGNCSNASAQGCSGTFFGDPVECVSGTCQGAPAPTATPGGVNTPTPGGANTPTMAPGELFCNDNFDNDFDGDVDCADSDCAGDPACSAGAPAMSNNLLGFLVIALGAIATFTLTRRASRS